MNDAIIYIMIAQWIQAVQRSIESVVTFFFFQMHIILPFTYLLYSRFLDFGVMLNFYKLIWNIIIRWEWVINTGFISILNLIFVNYILELVFYLKCNITITGSFWDQLYGVVQWIVWIWAKCNGKFMIMITIKKNNMRNLL